jgi:hypothetical protein
MKKEVLNAINNLKVSYLDFDQEYEGDVNSSAKHTFEFESENYLIKLELFENVKWESHEWYEFDNLEVGEFTVENQDKELKTGHITNEEILNNVNYG